jgi:hypothetical protein
MVDPEGLQKRLEVLCVEVRGVGRIRRRRPADTAQVGGVGAKPRLGQRGQNAAPKPRGVPAKPVDQQHGRRIWRARNSVVHGDATRLDHPHLGHFESRSTCRSTSLSAPYHRAICQTFYETEKVKNAANGSMLRKIAAGLRSATQHGPWRLTRFPRAPVAFFNHDHSVEKRALRKDLLMTKSPLYRPATPFLQLDRRSFMAGAGALGLGLMGLGAGPLRAQDMESVVHQLGWVKSIQFGGHFAAIHNGYFEEEGIEAEFLAGGPNSIGTDVAIATGQADTSDTDVPGTIRSRAVGEMPIKAFAAIMQKAPGAIMSLAESPLTSVTDFPGKTIAIPTGLQPQIAPS